MKQSHKKTPKQIAALVCVFLLAAMYVATLVVACLDLGDAGRLFAGCLLATIALPILLWIYIWLYGIYRDKHNMASLDMMHSDDYTGTNLPKQAVSKEDNDRSVSTSKS
jgi:hypothetical protein